MIVYLIGAALLLLALVNLWVSWRAIRDDLSTPLQRATHVVIIWVLPVLGAMLVLHFQRENAEPPVRRYGDSSDPGHDEVSPSRHQHSGHSMGSGPPDLTNY